MKFKIVFMTLLILISFNVFANENISAGKIRRIQYNQSEVITIHLRDLIETTIEYDKSESIVDVAVGDSLSFRITPSKKLKNILYIKSIIPGSESNMIVITDRNTYHYTLIDSQTNKDVIYHLIYEYSNGPKFKSNKSRDVNANQHTIDTLKEKNTGYSYKGSRLIVPSTVFDDGEAFTYFKFRKNQPLPAIYALDPLSRESLVNYRVSEGYVVVERISDRFILRQGNDQTIIYNDSISN